MSFIADQYVNVACFQSSYLGGHIFCVCSVQIICLSLLNLAIFLNKKHLLRLIQDITNEGIFHIMNILRF